MSEKLEEIAKREADAERERERARQERLADAEKLAKAVPERFFKLADEIRACVGRFNGAADPQKRLSLRESTALAARDQNLNADFNLSFSRAGVEVVVALNQMGRSGRPDAYLIEANGKLPNDTFLLRAEGSVKSGKIAYRISINFQRVEWPIDELADRLVRAAVKADLYTLIGL